MVAIVAPIPQAAEGRYSSPTLAELVAAQKEHPIYAYELTSDDERLNRLRRIYARKRAELDTFFELFDECTPDVVLRAADGRQLVLRLPDKQAGDTYSALRDALTEGLRDLEQQIVEQLQAMKQEAEWVRTNPKDNDSPRLKMRSAIMALCAPDSQTTTTPTKAKTTTSA